MMNFAYKIIEFTFQNQYEMKNWDNITRDWEKNNSQISEK